MTRWVWPELSPFFQSALREREKYQASPLSTVRLSASAFICATIKSSPLLASVATQVTRPSASNFGARRRPSSLGSDTEGAFSLPPAGRRADTQRLAPRTLG